jgi:hypothetical protein
MIVLLLVCRTQCLYVYLSRRHESEGYVCDDGNQGSSLADNKIFVVWFGWYYMAVQSEVRWKYSNVGRRRAIFEV